MNGYVKAPVERLFTRESSPDINIFDMPVLNDNLEDNEQVCFYQAIDREIPLLFPVHYCQLPERFVKVHQSFLVNFMKIEVIEGNVVRIGQKTIPISRQYKDELMGLITRAF